MDFRVSGKVGWSNLRFHAELSSVCCDIRTLASVNNPLGFRAYLSKRLYPFLFLRARGRFLISKCKGQVYVAILESNLSYLVEFGLGFRVSGFGFQFRHSICFSVPTVLATLCMASTISSYSAWLCRKLRTFTFSFDSPTLVSFTRGSPVLWISLALARFAGT